jgi:hypothetical protein
MQNWAREKRAFFSVPSSHGCRSAAPVTKIHAELQRGSAVATAASIAQNFSLFSFEFAFA